MSVSATYTGPIPQSRSETRSLLLVVFAAVAASYFARAFALSTDDAMRLVQVRDFLAGQSWFDLTQYRLSPPEGVSTHWSRLIDLPLAALTKIAGLLLPNALVERVTTIVYPLGFLLAFLLAVARLARELAGEAAARAALILAALTAPLLQHFRPGAIDHHNAQLVLLVFSLALALPARPRGNALAGVLCAVSLALGQEMAPALAALALTIALRWIIQGEAVNRATACFTAAWAVASVLLFAATVPPARYMAAACDALSIAQLLPVVLGGGGIAALVGLRGLRSPQRRLAAATALGALVAGATFLAFPACLGDPYANLDIRLTDLWLSNVNEARDFLSMLRDLPQEVLPTYGLLPAGVFLGVLQSLRTRDAPRWRWVISVAVLAVLSAVALWQVRGSAAANAIAIALVPAGLVCCWPSNGQNAVFLGLCRNALIAVALLNPVSLIVAGSAAARVIELAGGTKRPAILTEGPETCQRAASYAPLAALPRGLVLAFIDAGPFILLETPHAVLAAPYHRNVAGNGAMLDVFLATPGKARGYLASLGVDYVAFCAGSPERYNYAAAAPDGLAATLARNEVPDFLEALPIGGNDITVFRVRR